MKKIFISFVFLLSIALVVQVEAQDLQINEFVASNSSGLIDPDNGEFVDWIELYNSTGSAISLDGYSLTDELDTNQWPFPVGTTIAAHSYLLIYADKEDTGLHSNFKLSSKGENIYLYDGSNTIIDSIIYPEQVSDKAYGRKSDGVWVYMENPTPGSVNDETIISAGLVDLPVMQPVSGIYALPQSVTLTAEAGNTIRYTIDGTDPTHTSSVYSSSFVISSSATVKAISIQPDNVSSGITAKTYLINVSHNLPVISLTAVNYNENGGEHNKLTIDGKVYIEFIETDGTMAISQYADFAASGNSSESLPQLNGKLYSKEKYGEKYFNYKMYPNKKISKFRSFLLRNASQDFPTGHIRDALISRIISDGHLIDMPFEAYRPAVLYVNSKYEGIINIREDDDKYYAQANYGQDLSDYQKERLEFIYPLFDITDPDTHEAYAQAINLRQMYFHQSLLAGFCGQGEDGARIWRDSVKLTQFQYHLHDYDQAFAVGSASVVLYDPSVFTSIIRFNNSEKAEMLQFYAAQLNLFYDTGRTVPIYQQVMAEIRSEIPAHAEKNQEYVADFSHIFTSAAQWESNIAVILDYMKKRPQAMWNKVIAEHNLETIDLTHEVNDLSMGHIAVHGIQSTETIETGHYFSGLPMRLNAVPKPGYVFDHWEGAANSTDDAITLTLANDAYIKAVFRKSAAISSTISLLLLL